MTMDLKAALAMLVEGRSLSREEMTAVMGLVMSGQATEAQIGALLLGLRQKGETIDEIAGAATAMRALASRVEVADREHLVDLVGTGGDGANLFNVSTASSFVAAAAGARVAKHGNRSVSSTSGSSDVLEALGAAIDLDAREVARVIDEAGMGFMFAPTHHSAMRHAIGPRRDLGMRTIFNVLGPLTNPAGVHRQVVGVYDAALCDPLAQALKALGSEHAMVVHGEDGLDEISLAAPTHVSELRDGHVTNFILEPEACGIPRQSLEGLQVDGAAASAALIRAALGGETEARARRAADMIALNAGVTIYVAGLASTLQAGIRRAQELLADGSGLARLEQFVAATQRVRSERAA